MPAPTLDLQRIDLLRDLPDMIPVFRDFHAAWTVRVFDREQHECRNYLSPNRRDFYKILLITKGAGEFTTGLRTYRITEPTVLFIHPNDIISWRNLTPGEAGGHYVLFKKHFVQQHEALRSAMERHALFANKERQVIRLGAERAAALTGLFERMKAEEVAAGSFNEEAIQTYIQLLLIESLRDAAFPEAERVDDAYHHVHRFFELLEQEASRIDPDKPIRLRSAKEFAADLAIHPNHLNALLKKHTGQPVSAHIKGRLLEEAKVLLVRTDRSVQDIAYGIGFAQQPNFNQFFKRGTGLTPTAFREQHED